MESQHGNDERMQRAKQELFINPFSSGISIYMIFIKKMDLFYVFG